MRRKTIRIMPLYFIITISLLFFTGFLALYWINVQIENFAIKEAEHKARMLLDRNLSTHVYFSHDLKPAVFDLASKLDKPEYFDPIWMSSTYAVRETTKYFQEMTDSNYYYKEVAINARSPENEADPFERKILEKMAADPTQTEWTGIRDFDGDPYFVMMQAGETMEKTCLRCHSLPEVAPEEMVEKYGSQRSFNRHVGELVSLLSVRIPLSEAKQYTRQFTGKTLLVVLGAILFAFMVSHFMFRMMLLNPLSVVKNEAQDISEGKQELGVDIPSGSFWEWNQLIDAFNKMSRQLKKERDSLEEKVERSTKELTITNRNLQQEIEERKKAGEQIKANLKEKETLLQEVHHRVKNNMQVISSLLSLQSDVYKDDRIREALQSSQTRIYAMSAVHETIYSSDNLAEVDLNTYINRIASILIQTYAADPQKIQLDVNCPGIGLDVAHASPIGLTINELISNSLKYAFPDGREGWIDIWVDKKDQKVEIIIKDNGIGLPDDFDWENRSSLGLRLVRTLVENQLDGSINVDSGEGTRFTLSFNLK